MCTINSNRDVEDGLTAFLNLGSLFELGECWPEPIGNIPPFNSTEDEILLMKAVDAHCEFYGQDHRSHIALYREDLTLIMGGPTSWKEVWHLQLRKENDGSSTE